MPRYIDANALIKKIFPYDIVDKKDYSINAKAVADAIDNIPTADVVPRADVVREFAKFLIDKSQDGVIHVDEICDLVVEYTGKP